MSKRHLPALIALLALVLLGSGCVRHVVHRHDHGPHRVKHVTVLEREHRDGKIVVIHGRPGAARACWKHARHWHCRR